MNDDLIRRSDAIKAIMNKPAWYGSEGSWFHSDDIKDAINNIPAVKRGTIEYCGGCEYDKKISDMAHDYTALEAKYYALQKQVEPCKDAVSRQAVIDMLDGLSVDDERGFEFGTEEETFIGKYEAITNVSDLPSVTVEPKAESIIEACVEGMADAWKIAQTVFGSTVTLYEAMDVAKCMKGADNELQEKNR